MLSAASHSLAEPGTKFYCHKNMRLGEESRAKQIEEKVVKNTPKVPMIHVRLRTIQY